MQKKCFGFVAAMMMLVGAAGYAPASLAQNNNAQQVGMILFPVMRDQKDQQYIVTRAGYKVGIQGAGIAKDAKQIAVYQDNANNYWYINKKGAPTEVNPQQMARIQGQIQAQQFNGQANQNGNNPNPQSQNVTINNNAPSSGSSSGASALGTGLAAFGGAMGGAAVGAAMTGAYNQPYYGMPYGHPIYREPSSNKYYYQGKSGNNVYVAPTKQTSAMFNQYNQQGQWKDRNQWSNNPNWNKNSGGFNNDHNNGIGNNGGFNNNHNNGGIGNNGGFGNNGGDRPDGGLGGGEHPNVGGDSEGGGHKFGSRLGGGLRGGEGGGRRRFR